VRRVVLRDLAGRMSAVEPGLGDLDIRWWATGRRRLIDLDPFCDATEHSSERMERISGVSRMSRGPSGGKTMEFTEAFARLQSDRELAEKFVEDPDGMLSNMGVDTSQLVIQPVVGGGEPFKAVQSLRRLGPQAPPLLITVCASIGFIVCASVGGELDLVASEPPS